MKPSHNLENKTRSDIYLRIQLVCMKVQTLSSLELPLESGPDAFHESRFIMTFLTILEVMEILCSFRLVLEGKTGDKMPESSRLEFLEKFLADIFALSEAEDNTSRPLNWEGIADLALVRTLLAISQKYREPSFWEVMDSFVLVRYASMATLRTLFQRLLACLNFTLDL